MKSLPICVIVTSFAQLALVQGQGPLTPSGPPGPTMRTLDEIEPRTPLNQTNTPGDATCVFKITQPGSYILTGNLKAPTGRNGILIALLLPGVVEVDLKGFTIDGSDAGAGVAGALCTNEVLTEFRMRNGTLRNFAGHGCFQASNTCSFVFHTIEFIGGGAGVSTGGKLVMSNVSMSGGTGVPVRMGSDSELSHLRIKTTNPKIIDTTGSGYKLSDVIVSSVSSGAGQTVNAITLGPDSVVSGMRVRVSNATYTGPVLGNSSGFTEVSGLDMTVESVSATCVVDSVILATSVQYPFELTSSQGPYQFTSTQGPYQIKANNCTFSLGIGVVPSILSDDYCPRIIASGTTTAPTVLRVNGSHCTIGADISLAPTTNVTGGVITVHGASNTVSSTIRGLVSGGVGVSILSEQGSAVTGCQLMGRNDGAVTGIRIASGVTKVLVANNRATGFTNGSMFVDNQGGPSNAIAPIVNASNIGTNTNPLANLAQ